MSNEQFDDLPEPNREQIEGAVQETEPQIGRDSPQPAGDYPDIEETQLLEAAEEEQRAVASEVTQEDLSSADRIYDGALPEDLEQSNTGHREFVEDQADPGRQATIDSRIRQEEPEPGFDVVPDNDAREPTEDQIDVEDLP